MKNLVLLLIIVLVSACAPYALIEPGANAAGPISFETSTPWTKYATYKPGPKAEIWTANGTSLDSVMIFKGVEDGKTLFSSANKQNPMPEFKADMLPQEVLELVQTSMAKYYGENNILLTIDGLKPTKFLEAPGFRFDMKFSNQAGLNYLGKGIATIRDDALYMMLYTGTQLHYFDLHEQEFENIISSAKL